MKCKNFSLVKTTLEVIITSPINEEMVEANVILHTFFLHNYNFLIFIHHIQNITTAWERMLEFALTTVSGTLGDAFNQVVEDKHQNTHTQSFATEQKFHVNRQYPKLI